MTDACPKVGQRVHISGKNLKGRVAYVGFTSFASGKWVGVVLDDERGKNNGTIRGTSYFKCAPKHGIFVRPTQLVIMMTEQMTTVKSKGESAAAPVAALSKVKAIARKEEEKDMNKDESRRVKTVSSMMATAGSIKEAGNEEDFDKDDEDDDGDVEDVKSSASVDVVGGIKTTAEQSTAITSSSINVCEVSATPKEAVKGIATLSNVESLITTTTQSATATTTTTQAKPPLKMPSALTMTFTKMSPTMTTGATTMRSTSSTQLRPTRISQPKPTTSHQLSLAVPFALAPKRSKTSMSPTASFCCVKRSSFVETGFLEILRPQFTPGHPLRTPVSASPPSAAVQPSPSVDNSELQQLRGELELLRTQRTEDKRKLHDLEKLRIQNDHLLEFKTKIMSQHGLLQRELQRNRQELRESYDVAAKYKRELDEIAESIELLTLDKEMAEERAETLQMELELAQERNDELTLDVEILRAESEGKHGAGQDGNILKNEGLYNAGDIIRLEQYNQRLRDTVIRLRDTLAQEKQELLKANKELETKYSEISELKKIKETLTKRLDNMELQINDLNEQVDAALGAESMVTSLAELKLDLEERVKLLEEEVKELEALEEIHEQLLESNQDLENDLREEIEKLSTSNKLLEKEKDAAQESVYDREVTIQKFRELVRNLNEQLQLKDTAAAFSIEDFSSTNSDAQSNDFQHVFSSTKAYSRAIEQQLKSVELKLQRKHIEYLMAFVPEDFMLRGGEHDVLLVMLLLQRIGEKVDIISGAINEKFPTACEFGRDAIFEGYAVQRFGFRAKCTFLLKTLKLALQQMLHGLNHSDYEVCIHAAIYRTDLEAQEQHIDEFLRLLKAGLLDEHTPCDALERLVNYINSLLKNLLSPQALVELLDEQQLYGTLVEVYEAGLDCVNTNAGLLHTIIQLGDEQTESFQSMQFLMDNSCVFKQKLKKLQRRLTADNSAWTGMQCARYQHIQDTNEALGILINILATSAKEATKDNMAITHEKLWRLLALNYSKYSHSMGGESPAAEQQNTASFGQQCMQMLEAQMDQLNELIDAQEHMRIHANVHTVCVRHATTNTLLQRAAQVRQHYEDVKALEQCNSEREKEIKMLKCTAKMKQQDYSELQIRKEMADKQLSKLGHDQMQMLGQLANAVELLEQLLLTKEATFINALNDFNDKLQKLERTQQVWQEHLASANVSATTTTVASNRELQLLHAALRAERQQNSTKQTNDLKLQFLNLAPIFVPQRRDSTCNQDQVRQLERDLQDLKRAWLLSHITLNDNSEVTTRNRRAIEARSSEVLRHICETYCATKPHRAANTHFGFFVSNELRQALFLK